MSVSLLDDPKRLTGRLLRGMSDIVETVNPEVGGAARASGSAFMTSISKSSGGGSGGPQFGETISLFPRSTNNVLDYNLDRVLPSDCKGNKECRAAKARIKARIEKERAAADEELRKAAELAVKFKVEAEEFRKRDIIERGTCASVGALRQLVYRRRIPFSKMGRSLRFNRRELDRFLEINTYPKRRSA